MTHSSSQTAPPAQDAQGHAGEMAADLDGLQIVQRMLDGRAPQAPIAATLSYRLVSASWGLAVFEGEPSVHHMNPQMTVHGGWIATLLDSALGCAVRTTLPVGRTYTTTDLKVSYVRAITSKVQRVLAEGQVLHSGRQLATATGRLYAPDGTVYAHATATCLVLAAPARRPHPTSTDQGKH